MVHLSVMVKHSITMHNVKKFSTPCRRQADNFTSGRMIASWILENKKSLCLTDTHRGSYFHVCAFAREGNKKECLLLKLMPFNPNLLKLDHDGPLHTVSCLHNLRSWRTARIPELLLLHYPPSSPWTTWTPSAPDKHRIGFLPVDGKKIWIEQMLEMDTRCIWFYYFSCHFQHCFSHTEVISS